MFRPGGIVLLLAACSADGSDTLAIRAASPDHGPLAGGSRIVLTGTGFQGGAPNRVLIGREEAPLAAALDDTELEVVIPPGAQPGDAEVIVFNRNGHAQATGVFRYSTPPTIATITPGDVVFTSTSTTVTVVGAGFVEDGAGKATVFVDGIPADGVAVVSDTTLTFTAPPGIALTRPSVVVINDRGTAVRDRGYRYVPGSRGGLLLFPPSSGAFAIFFDPIDSSTVAIPSRGSGTRFTTVVLDDRGDYLGLDRARKIGRIDMKTQQLVDPVQSQVWFPAMARVDDRYIAIDRSWLRFATFDPATGMGTWLGNQSAPCCGSYGIASDGPTIYFTGRQGADTIINTLDRVTGAIGTPVTLVAAPGFHIEDMRFFDGKLYAASRDNKLATIDPVTGVTTVLPVFLGRFTAMEVFQ